VIAVVQPPKDLAEAVRFLTGEAMIGFVAWGTFRQASCRLSADANGLVVRNRVGTRTVRWNEVADAHVGRPTGRPFLDDRLVLLGDADRDERYWLELLDGRAVRLQLLECGSVQ
jgi:hypothetical protein